MRLARAALVVIGLSLVTAQVFAAIKAMSLAELMDVTHEAALVRITGSRTFALDLPFEGAVYTALHVKGESLRTGEPIETDVVFLGSHDPRDHFGTSEMPTLQDTRVGNDAILFFSSDASLPGGPNRVSNLAGVYRIEQAFGTQIVIGKGEGAAFPANIKLAEARDQIRATHLQQEAAKAEAGK